MQNTPRIGVLGGGSWATALVKLLCNHTPKVNWWMRNKEAREHILAYGHNPNYIQSIEFDKEKLYLTGSVQEVVDKSDYIVIAIPSAFLHETVKEHKPRGLDKKVLFSAIKGIITEYDSIPARYFHKQFGTSYDDIGIICGPCHAEEVALEKLSYLTVGSKNPVHAETLAKLLSCRFIKTNTTEDVFGAELAAILKNVYAVASGICHGIGYGDNFQAVLISSAIREIERFLDAVHEVHRDVKSSAYLGDLLVTAYSPYSRNRTFGTMVGKGYSVKWATIEMNMVAEGYYAAKGIHAINKKFKADIPIADAVYRILYEKVAPMMEMRLLQDKLS
ncbi:MAG: NAD(P)H-dependent glycerol-3-phosphate dehydrogenase [Flavobacteriales bacterium]|nr:NAD(P)H-dependent glycerol-3-phosphate dehydrogenase [Flavobacteriales bacterium]